MSDRADRPLPLPSPSPPPTPWQQSWARERRGSPQQLQRARVHARARRQNLGGGGAGPGGARARERAHAAVFFSHNPEAAAREGRRVGGRIWARREKRAPFDGGLVALVGGEERGVMRHCGWEAVTPAPPERAEEEAGARRWFCARASQRRAEKAAGLRELGG